MVKDGRRSWDGTSLAASRNMETSSCWETVVFPSHNGRKLVLLSNVLNLKKKKKTQNLKMTTIFHYVLLFFLDQQQLWKAVAKGMGAKRLAVMSRISRDGFRSPVVTMLLGEHSWVKHVDNRIRYNINDSGCFSSDLFTATIPFRLNSYR